jgi:hypothetical protein
MKLLSNLQEKKQRMQVFNKIIAILFLIPLIGCATGSVIVTGTVRPATKPSEVKIYLDPPAQFETIGIVDAARDVDFSRQKAQDKAIIDLKTRAAKIGANGILLTNTSSQSVGVSAVYTNGFFIGGVSGDRLHAQGRAIYVIRE